MPELIKKGIVTPKGLIDFRFEPLKINDTLIFAVYCHYNGSIQCFHLGNAVNTRSFKILDKHNCPYDFQELEHLFSDMAIDYSAF